MVSVMVQRCVPYAILGRLLGCFFIHNFRGNSLRNAKVTWKTPYTFYSISCYIFYIFLETMFATHFARVIRNISDALSRSLLLVVFGVVVVKLIANLSVMLTKPDELLAFFRKSEAFETNTGISPRTRRSQDSAAVRWNVLRKCGVYMGLVLYFTLTERFIMVDIAQSMPPEWSVPTKIFASFLGIGFLCYESLSYFFLRSCTEVLVEYIQIQVELFQKAGEFSHVHFRPPFSSQVDAMRLRIDIIRKLKESLNNIWAGPLIVSCASTIIVDCVVLDAVFHDGIRTELWLVVGYSVYASLCFVDLAYTGQAFIDEVRKLKSALLMVPTFGESDSYLRQLRYLHESVNPDEMCLGGGGFFVLKRSLLLSMTGSVITFGVILVQTSNTVSLRINAA
ncbi:unnamed protein product [Ixodes persulcatus]